MLKATNKRERGRDTIHSTEGGICLFLIPAKENGLGEKDIEKL